MTHIIVYFSGVAAGFLNIMGGGGSMITVPVLIFLGLPPVIANGTNRIAVMVEALSGTLTFRSKGYFFPQMALTLAVPAVLGSVIGTMMAVNISDEMFNRVLGVIMLIVLLLIIIRPEKKFLKDLEILKLEGKRKLIAMVAFFFIGVYGGFIQIGVGFFMIVSLALLTGMDLIKINALKTMIVVFYTAVALILFVANTGVEWRIGLVLALGNGTGAFLGSHFAIRSGERLIRIVLTVTVLVMTAKLWGLW
jgi:hypothetical protein